MSDQLTTGVAQGPRSGRRGRVRWLIIVTGALGLTIAYIDRSNLSVAAPFIQKEFHFSDSMKGVLLSAFFWTYAVFQLPSGWLVDRFGPRRVYALAVVWWSIWTAATALARGLGSLFGTRLLLGMGEAPVQPTNAKVVSEWFPPKERAFASSIYDTGQQLGTALSVPVITAIIAGLGWRFAFVVTGVVGLTWIALWLWVYRPPRRHRWLSRAELDHIESGTERPAATEPGAPPVRWRDLLKHSTVWGLICGYICRAFVVYFFITWYPSYLVDARGFTIVELGVFGSIPALLAIGADWLGGAFSDYLLRRGLPLSRARKIPIIGGMLLASVIALTPFVHGNLAVMVLLSFANCSSAFAAGAVLSLPTHIAPTTGTVGSVAGLQNFGSQVGGIISPIVVGFLLDATGGSYALPLLVAAAMAVAGAVIYALVVKVRPLPA